MTGHFCVPVRLVPGHRWATALGPEPSLFIGGILAHAVLPFLVLGLVGLFLPSKWYEGAKQRSSHKGRLSG